MGVLSMRINAVTGEVIGATLAQEEDELMLITDGGVLIRTAMQGIRRMRRVTQGVRLINLDEGSRLVSVARIVDTGKEGDDGRPRPRLTAATAMSTCQVSVIIPTYREAENIPIVSRRIHETLVAAALTHEIIISDDDSPDGTAALCETLSTSSPSAYSIGKATAASPPPSSTPSPSPKAKPSSSWTPTSPTLPKKSPTSSPSFAARSRLRRRLPLHPRRQPRRPLAPLAPPQLPNRHPPRPRPHPPRRPHVRLLRPSSRRHAPPRNPLPHRLQNRP